MSNNVLDALFRLADTELYTKIRPYSYRPEIHLEKDEQWKVKMYGDMIERVKDNLESLTNSVKILIAYVVLTKDKEPESYSIHLDMDGNLSLQHGYQIFGPTPMSSTMLVCSAHQMVKIMEGAISIDDDLVDVLVETQWIPYIDRSSAQELLDIGMEPSSAFIRNINDWVSDFTNYEPYGSFYGNRDSIISYIYRLKALKVFEFVFEQYPPAGCRKGRIPVFNSSLNDIVIHTL